MGMVLKWDYRITKKIWNNFDNPIKNCVDRQMLFIFFSHDDKDRFGI